MKQSHLHVVAILLVLAACEGAEPLAPVSPQATRSPATSPHVVVAAPSNAFANAMNDTRIDFSWQDNSTNEGSFEVYRSTTGAAGVFALLATTAANVRYYVNAELPPLTEHCYRVRALATVRTKVVASALSNVSCATTSFPLNSLPPASPQAPAAASGATIQPQGSNELIASWTDNSANEEGFRVYASLDGGATYTYHTGTAANQTGMIASYWHQGENPICYVIFAYLGNNYSAPSNTTCIQLVATPHLMATRTDDEFIDLSWIDKSEIEDGYEVHLFVSVSCGEAVCDAAFEPDYSNVDPRVGLIVRLPANATQYRAPALAGDRFHYYSYSVVGVKDDYQSSFSNNVGAW